MNPLTSNVFDLPDHLAAKVDPTLIAGDEQHFAAIAQTLAQTIAELSDRLAAERRAPGGHGQVAMERDMQIHRLTARLRTLRRFGVDLCLGHMVSTDTQEPVYVGRLGLTDSAGRQLLIDWRSPAAEPFFGATHANPMGLASRRRYRWSLGRISDYWDEVFSVDGTVGLEMRAALDDQSAFIASLGRTRSPRMRDVLGTIASDQDAIIRAGSRGALVVDGGPGTGKTVVALHRTAYLLYSDPRLGHRRGGVLFVGPHQPYLAYVADVLPSLGEEGVHTCTLRDLVAEGAAAGIETDPRAARLKSSADMVEAIETAVRFYEKPPTTTTTVGTPWSDLVVSPDDWAEAFDAADPGTPHNEAREEIWEALLTILLDKNNGAAPAHLLRKSLLQNRDLLTALNSAWTLIEAADLVADLWTVPAYLRMCAPWLGPDEAKVLQRNDAQAWTVSDLPLLDAARQRLGDPETSRRERRKQAIITAERELRDRVVEDLVAADDSDMLVMSMLRGQDLQDALVDETTLPNRDQNRLAGQFAHIVVDEAQELTDAEWQMLLLRCPSRSFTIVGDRAQARHGFAESWPERLQRIGLDEIKIASLSINYRTPEEIMAEAEPIIRAVLPDANVPTSIRSTGVPVLHESTSDLRSILDTWLGANVHGIACVISTGDIDDGVFWAAERGGPRVRSLTPELSKGLEFDLVVVIDPETFGTGIEGAVDRYVAMTRATQQLVILRNRTELRRDVARSRRENEQDLSSTRNASPIYNSRAGGGWQSMNPFDATVERGRLGLAADCANCFGLCCVAPAFRASALFAIDKPYGQPCPNLLVDFGCGIHQTLRQQGFSGCTAYTCFGAGQKISQETFRGTDWRRAPETAEQMFQTLPIMRQLHESLWFTTEALELLRSWSRARRTAGRTRRDRAAHRSSGRLDVMVRCRSSLQGR